VHLVMPPLPPPLASDEALLLTAPGDGRVFFLVPWYGATLLGTTDRDWQGDPGALAVDAAEADYLLTAVRARLPGLGWSSADIRASFAGVRTLQQQHHQQRRAASAVTREWLLTQPRPGLWVPIGGKLTSARADAAALADGVAAACGRSGPPRTGDRLLPWAPAGPFHPWLGRMAATGAALGLAPGDAATLARRHGTTVAALHARIAADPRLGQRLHPQAPFLRAELVHAVSAEMACTLDDVLRRRVPLAITARLDPGLVERLAQELAESFGWSATAASAAAAQWWHRHGAAFDSASS
jgi:glycerol-3-phosphate dehydrogenase